MSPEQHPLTDPDPVPLPANAPRWQRAAHDVTEDGGFQSFIVGVILTNALVIGLETYSWITDRWGEQLHTLNAVFLGIFVVELFIRIAAVGFRINVFFRGGWNIFDTIVVTASFIPGVRENATLLRLARLLRVTRLLRLMPDLHLLLDGLRRAAKPAASLLALTFLLVYLYAVLGWTLFHESVPKYFGNLGEAMLTLFTLLTLEGWNEILGTLREASAWALPYTLSFILVGTFVVLNLVIGVVITSLDEAYGAQKREAEGADLSDAIDDVRRALDSLERRMSGTPGDPRLLSMGDHD